MWEHGFESRWGHKMENIKETKIEVTFPEGLTAKDIELIRAQCALQKATSKEQIEGFAAAYLEAKELAHDTKKLNSVSAEDIENFILRWAKMIEKRNEKGYATTPRVFKDGSRALDPSKIPQAMKSFSNVYENITPAEAYEEFEEIHPFEDGNGRLGDLLWKIAKSRKSGQWPEELPPDIFIWGKLADELDELQKTKNDGGGVSAVQTIIAYLKMGDVRSAKAVCNNDGDKISDYPDIRKILQQKLFIGINDKDMPPHFRQSSDYLYDK